MTGPLAALVMVYDKHREWTLALPHLGLPGSARGRLDVYKLPPADIAEISAQTKEPYIFCIESGNPRTLHPLKSPASWNWMRKQTKTLVHAGIHPLDIVIAEYDTDNKDFTFRNSVDHLLWTFEDQRNLDGDQSL